MGLLDEAIEHVTNTAEPRQGIGCERKTLNTGDGGMSSGVYHRPRKTAPPLGLLPRKFWIENRADDILEAMERYRRGTYSIPVEWVEELAEHLRTLDQSR